MVTTGSDDPEGDLLERIRALPGAKDLPLFAVFDLHANFTPTMARYADGLVGYRENPHADAFDAAALSAELLARSLATGVRPRIVSQTYPVLWPPTGTGTADTPDAHHERARAAHRDGRSGRLGGQRRGRLLLRRYARHRRRRLRRHDRRHRGRPSGISTPSARSRCASARAACRASGTSMRRIDDALANPPAGPAILVEPADNIGGGAPGDCTSDPARLRCARGLQNAAVVDQRSALRSQALAGAGRPASACCRIGGSSSLDPGPVELEVELLSRSDGRFTLEDRNSHLAASQGVHIEMGPCATVRAGGVDDPADVAQDAALRSRPVALAGHRAGDAGLRRREGGGRAPARL